MDPQAWMNKRMEINRKSSKKYYEGHQDETKLRCLANYNAKRAEYVAIYGEPIRGRQKNPKPQEGGCEKMSLKIFLANYKSNNAQGTENLEHPVVEE